MLAWSCLMALKRHRVLAYLFPALFYLTFLRSTYAAPSYDSRSLTFTSVETGLLHP